jgi:DNA integrity scanning protein DisA with diadenylate cyclase activity
MKDKLTQKQENFCLNILQGMSQREAYIQSYKPAYAITTIDANASRLASNEKVLKRLSELREKAQNNKIASVIERKEILSEIARASMANFVEVGQDGAWFNIDNTNLNNRAISSVQSKTVVGKDGADDAVFIRVNLRDPIEAIKELNKMDGVYAENTTVVNNDNRSINIIVQSEKGKKITESLMSGEV